MSTRRDTISHLLADRGYRLTRPRLAVVEVLADVAIRIPPITAAEARRALESLKGRAVLFGVRGAPADRAIAQAGSRRTLSLRDPRRPSGNDTK